MWLNLFLQVSCGFKLTRLIRVNYDLIRLNVLNDVVKSDKKHEEEFQQK